MSNRLIDGAIDDTTGTDHDPLAADQVAARTDAGGARRGRFGR